MNGNQQPLGLILGGFFLILGGGIVLPLLIVIGIVPSTFLLDFLGYAVSVAGLMMGVVGGAMVVRETRKK
jgi:uncharacterized membrane protein